MGGNRSSLYRYLEMFMRHDEFLVRSEGQTPYRSSWKKWGDVHRHVKLAAARAGKQI